MIVQVDLKYGRPLIPLDLERVQYIVLHHIAAKTATPAQIHQWHLDRGWNGAGYNEYIRKDGTVHIMRGDHIGAQCHGYNSKSYGIAVEGDYDKERFMPLAQMNSLAKRIAFHEKRLPNLKETVPHSAFAATACPGAHFPTKFVSAVSTHWAEEIYESLTTSYGLEIHEKRFDDKITRGEAMALIAQALDSLKYYIDHHR